MAVGPLIFAAARRQQDLAAPASRPPAARRAGTQGTGTERQRRDACASGVSGSAAAPHRALAVPSALLSLASVDVGNRQRPSGLPSGGRQERHEDSAVLKTIRH